MAINRKSIIFIGLAGVLAAGLGVLFAVTRPQEIVTSTAEAALDQASAALRAVQADRMGFRATRLSGGQKQRVAIARSLINRPLLVLADEPTGNLDRESAEQVLSLMREMNRQDGVTFLICTHDEHVASQCSRRIVLVDGRVGAESSSSNL